MHIRSNSNSEKCRETPLLGPHSHIVPQPGQKPQLGIEQNKYFTIDRVIGFDLRADQQHCSEQQTTSAVQQH